MCENSRPQVEAGIDHDAGRGDAYIRVRVPNPPRQDGSVLVYLSNSTGIVVNADQLVYLDDECEPSASRLDCGVITPRLDPYVRAPD